MICLLLFVGATGKSAQIPLYVWLPDAMEGPTPVSALIHAATMVTAGVYMVGRNAVLFTHAPMVMTIVAIVGVLTALMAASIGLVQYDIKRVLAYSTVSQLGYMFMAMGVGAFSAGAFHLMTHAFFKALLFLGSGSVIHAMARRAGHAAHGRPEEVPAGHLRDDDDRHAGDCRHSAVRRVLQQGRDPVPRVPGEQDRLGPRGRHGVDDRVLHVPPDGDDVLRQLSRAGMGAHTAARPWHVAAIHGVPHPADAHAHGQAHKTTSATDRHARPRRRRTTRTPTMRMGTVMDRGMARTNRRSAMTMPLMALAVGAIVAGFVGILRALGGTQRHRAFPRAELHASSHAELGATAEHGRRHAPSSRSTRAKAEDRTSRGALELGLMAFSVLIAVARHRPAYRFYVAGPEIAEGLKERYAGAAQPAAETSTTWTSCTTRPSINGNDGGASGSGRSIAASSTAP